MRLADFAADSWSQFGEDGIIEHIFHVIGLQSSFCVEFGAGDGINCSNTKRLRKAGWSALLIEADPDRFTRLQTESSDVVECVQSFVTPANINVFLADRPVDFISIDVDGDDYAIFEAMTSKPRVVCVEYNGSIPPHIDLRQQYLGEGFGASALALCNLAADKGYVLLGLTKGNLFFIQESDLVNFPYYQCGLLDLFQYDSLSYLVTDYQGRPVATGAVPPWGLAPVPFVGCLVGDSTVITRQPQALREGFEALHGPALIPDVALNLSVEVPGPDYEQRLQGLMATSSHVIIDISNHQPTANFDWIVDVADRFGYDAKIIPAGVIAIFPRKSS